MKVKMILPVTARLRHLAYAAGWKKFEPCWDFVIRARRAGMMLPLLETILGEFGKRAPRAAEREDRVGALTDVALGVVVKCGSVNSASETHATSR